MTHRSHAQALSSTSRSIPPAAGDMIGNLSPDQLDTITDASAASVLAEQAQSEARPIAEAARPFHEFVDATRRLDVCPACDKTRAQINMNIVGSARGFHHPVKLETISPQTHCACPDGPLPDADQYVIRFRRYGNRARIHLVDGEGREELLIHRIIKFGSRGLDFAKQNGGSLDAAINLLRLVTTEERALRLANDFRYDHLRHIPFPGGQITLGTIRAWVAGKTGDLDLDLAALIRDRLDGKYGDVSHLTDSDAAIYDVVGRVEPVLKRALTPHEHGRIALAVTLEWNNRIAAAGSQAIAEGADAAGVSV